MHLDDAQLRALHAVVREGSFERAARALHVTPSAVSQRIKALEERCGAVLVVRGQPCQATDVGRTLCRHAERVALLEQDLRAALPGAAEETPATATLRIAVNADSLATWVLPGIAAFTQATGMLVDLVVDDQDHTADALRRGDVLAAVTARAAPVQGCRSLPLGRLRYLATASPAFVQRHFAHGVNARTLAAAPSLRFNPKDELQARWVRRVCGRAVPVPQHGMPASVAFIDAAVLGIGWGLNPELLAAPAIAAGRLVELVPGQTLETPLHWQVSRLESTGLDALTRAMRDAARVLQPAAAGGHRGTS